MGNGVDDCISRQAATTIPVMPKEHRHYQTNNLDDAYEQGWNDLQECIEKLPTVQPNHNAEVSKMEIIHCKDCKFAQMTVDGECKYCDIWFPYEKTYMPGDYYCASAEKRGEADGQN